MFARFFRWVQAEPDDDQEVYDSAALDQLGLGWFMNGVLGDISAEQTATMRAKIDAKREWVNNLSDPRWRRAFGRWLNHAEYRCRQADRYREERPEKDRRWRQREAERRAVEMAKRTLPPVA
jgi:hypothetical protein